MTNYSDKTQKIDFGKIIREHRRKKHLTQKQLADMLGISYQLLQKYEYNKCRPSLERMLVLTHIIGININRLKNINGANTGKNEIR